MNMCWHICNNCNDVNNPDGDYGRNDTPCLWFVPNVDETGLRGCPYAIPGEGDEEITPACWVAITDEEAEKIMSQPEYHDDTMIDEDEHGFNQRYINGFLGEKDD